MIRWELQLGKSTVFLDRSRTACPYKSEWLKDIESTSGVWKIYHPDVPTRWAKGLDGYMAQRWYLLRPGAQLSGRSKQCTNFWAQLGTYDFTGPQMMIPRGHIPNMKFSLLIPMTYQASCSFMVLYHCIWRHFGPSKLNAGRAGILKDQILDLGCLHVWWCKLCHYVQPRRHEASKTRMDGVWLALTS